MPQSELYRRAYEQLKAGNYDEAKRLFRDDEEKSGTAAETKALVRQAETRLAEGNLQRRRPRSTSSIVERNPSLPEVYLGLSAHQPLHRGSMDAARVHATAAVRLGPDLGLSWTVMGAGARGGGRYWRRRCELTCARPWSCPPPSSCASSTWAGADRRRAAPRREPRRCSRPPSSSRRTRTASTRSASPASRLRQYGERAARLREGQGSGAGEARLLGHARRRALRGEGVPGGARGILDRGLAACGDHPALLEKALATAMMLSDAEGPSTTWSAS